MFFHAKVLQAGKNDRGFQHLCIKWHLLQAGEGRQYTTQFTVGILSASWTASKFCHTDNKEMVAAEESFP